MEKQVDSLNKLVDAALLIEKLRVSSKIRQTHLELQGRQDPETDELHRRLVDLEGYVDGRVAILLKSHPAYPWFSQVKGVGKENIGKIVGLINVTYDGEHPFRHVSSIHKYAGFAVEDGVAPKPTPGTKLSYNKRLRSMCWRLGSSLMRAGLRKKCLKCGEIVGNEKLKDNGAKCPGCGNGEFETTATTAFCRYYLNEKAKYIEKYTNQGRNIVPAQKLPKNDKGLRYETEGVISEGHVHNQALRKMIKLFLSCLVIVWRDEIGMPLPKPYAIGQLGHNSYIDPWEMIDK